MAQLSQTNLINDANLVSYYKLEDTSDSSVNSHTLTNNNSVTFTSAKYNNGANFGIANTNKMLSVASNLGIDGGVCSIVGWIKILTEITSGSWYMVAQSSNTSKVSYYFGYNYNSGSIQAEFHRDKGGVGVQFVTKSGALGTSPLHHFALTYDGTTLIGYLDGLSVGSVAASGNGTDTNTPSSFSIGAYNYGSGPIDYSSILADDVAVFSRVLLPSEIRDLASEFLPSYQGAKDIQQPYFQTFDINSSIYSPNIGTYFKPPLPPQDIASWLKDTIEQPYFTSIPLNIFLLSPVNIGTYFKSLGWYKIRKKTDIWTKIVKRKITSG